MTPETDSEETESNGLTLFTATNQNCQATWFTIYTHMCAFCISSQLWKRDLETDNRV